MDEKQAVNTLAQGLLEGSTPLTDLATSGIWRDAPPIGKEPPYVVWSTSSSIDDDTNGNVRIETDFTISVQLISLNDQSISDGARPLIDGLFEGVHTFANGFLIDIKRQAVIDRMTAQGDRYYYYGGGRYLVQVRPFPGYE